MTRRSEFDLPTALAALEAAAAQQRLSSGAVANIRAWLTEPRYREFAPQVAEHLAHQKFQELDDAFWTIIPFGTGGRRGKMYPIGSNTINDRTIGESAQGLADYARSFAGQKKTATRLAVAIAYDTRHRSREFAERCAEVMVAAGFQVYFLDGYRGTPELSFAVRHEQCACGLMVTASHNPPSDNAVKAYWSTGGQLLPPHDQGVIDRVMNVDTIDRVSFADALADGRIVYRQAEVDAAYLAALMTQAKPGPRELRVVYSPLHGVGASAIMPLLAKDGFGNVELFGPHAEPNGDFPNVPGHVSNPENPAVFDSIIAHARATGADLVIATDPDCDRLGLAAPLTLKPGAAWATMTGNQIGALLTEYVLARRRAAGQLDTKSYVVKTLVTTELVRRIADAYNARTVGELLVGFKWIGGAIDEQGPEHFVFGAEESHGYLVGQHARDKDAVVAAMLVAELAAEAKAAGKSLHEKLDALYWQYGCHVERQVSVTMPGSEGMARMTDLMRRFRAEPPTSLGGLKVARVRDYLSLAETAPGTDVGRSRPLVGPRGDMVMLDLAAEGTFVAVRPSGTEPKVKYYLFAFEPAEMLANLDATKQELAERLDAIAADLAAFAQN